ncbi:hypothetical protein, partial [Sporisorium scitamineum]
VALANLRDHADNIEKGAKALIDHVAQKELKRMQSLLQGYERDLRILAMVKSKMSAVADACNRVYTELRERIERIDSDLSLIRNDTLGLSEEVESTTPQVADDTYQRVV